MKKFFGSKSAKIFTLALISGAAMIQACGHSNSGTISQSSCTYWGQPGCNSAGVPSIPGLPTSTTPYQLCSMPNFNPNILTAYATATDGTQVCKIRYLIENNYNGIQEYLGPSVSFPQGVPMSSIQLTQFDAVTVTATGSSNGTICSTWGSFDAPLYIDVYGSPSTTVSAANELIVPAGVNGVLGVGLDKNVNPHGCFMIDLKATITRCVDTSGNTHACQ